MKCRGWLYAPKTGSAAGAALPGHASADPSTATPIDAAAGTVISVTGGIVFLGGSCQYVYPMCVWSIMWSHLPCASVWLKKAARSESA